ncbi:hypothetical protein [Streptomyces sp. NRRL F-6674]|uniref:hypothetical protein n=1 Tax=Streptomyces sp. NRRL F-6674 TaxID=1463877 RepID=UPI000AC7564A|nr:hypothetical protein [Streptomyces sp. NRRL F-6674]
MVDGAGDVSRAVRAALARATSVQERRARGGGSFTGEDLEVRGITLDVLGHTCLDAPGHTRPDGPGDRSATPSW